MSGLQRGGQPVRIGVVSQVHPQRGSLTRMGVTTAFFAASPTELRAHFADWKEPLAEPARRRVVNPFTKRETEVLAWDPDPSFEPNTVDAPEPCLFFKLDTQINALLRLVMDDGRTYDVLKRPALIGPDDGSFLGAWPTECARKLATLEGKSVDALAAQWGEECRRDIASIANESARRSMLEAWPLAAWRDVLHELATFARAHVHGDRTIYMFVTL
jgi:hypothetical protein